VAPEVYPSFMNVDALLRSTALAAARLAALIRSIRRPEAQAVGHWTSADVAVHLADRFEVFPRMVHGEGAVSPSLEEMSSFNDERVLTRSDRELSALADAVEQGGTEFVHEMSAADTQEEIQWVHDIRLPRYTFGGLVLGEALVHGYDIASAEGITWPIDPTDVHLAFEALIPLIPYYLDGEAARGLDVCFDLRLRGGPRRFLAVSGGSLEVAEPDARKVDCRISADAPTFLLVSYGRIRPVRPAMTGKIVAWGRKPWLGLKLPRLIRSP
jgi:uncharacterized protein (TIGR03083 family)